MEQKYSEMFVTVRNSLKPGGMLVYGDHVGTWGLYKQIRVMEQVEKVMSVGKFPNYIFL